MITYYYQNGDKYEGKLINDKKKGRGKMYGKKSCQIYIGEFENDKRKGDGIMIDFNGCIYNGER